VCFDAEPKGSIQSSRASTRREALAHQGWTFSGLQSVLQAAVCDGGVLDAFSLCEDRLRSAEVDVSWREVFDVLVIADVICSARSST
jgi:hypothetical protein